MPSSKLYWLLAVVFLSGCTLLGFNPKRKTPQRAKPYPAFTAADSLLGGAAPARTAFDVHHYRLQIAIDPEEKSVQGTVTASFRMEGPAPRLQWDLAPELSVLSVTLDGQPTEYQHKGRVLWVIPHTALPVGSLHEVAIEYQGQPLVAKKPPWVGGMVWKQDDSANAWAGVACERVGASVWWPLKDDLHDEPDSADMVFTVPKGLTCVSNGQLVEETHGATTSTFHWQVKNPINTYNITFYLGTFEVLSQAYTDITGADRTLEFWVLPQHRKEAVETLAKLPKVMEVFEKNFGPYPWWEDGFKLVNSPYEGMEHQTAIAYGADFEEDFRGLDYILVHETAHEWWGNSVSVGDFRDIWIHEGLATYAEAVYMEATRGAKQARDYLRFEAVFIRNRRPVRGPAGVRYWDHRDSDPYLKGAWMMHTLRGQIHDDAVFFELLWSFYLEHQKSLVTTEDFIAHVNQHTEDSWQWFFDQYLDRREVPLLEYQWVEENNERVGLRMRWRQVADDFRLQVPLQVGRTQQWVTVTPEGTTVSLNGESYVSFLQDLAYFALKEVKN